MKTFQIVTLFALIAASMAFSPNQLPQGEDSTLRCFPRCLKQHSHGTIAGSKDQVAIHPRWSVEEWEWLYSIAVNWRPWGRSCAFGHALALKYA